jgi:hypothetical protein
MWCKAGRWAGLAEAGECRFEAEAGATCHRSVDAFPRNVILAADTVAAGVQVML